MGRIPDLPNTAEVLSHIRANSVLPFGGHAGHEVVPSAYGRNEYERRYDPREHRYVLPNPLSAREAYLNEPQVTYKRQLSPIFMDIILLLDHEDRNQLDWITASKDATAFKIAEALVNLQSGIGDHFQLKVIGDVDRWPKDWLVSMRPELIAPKKYSKNYINIERPSFIIGSMNHGIPATKVSEGAVGIKIDHQFDRKLVPGIGLYATGHPEYPYVDTNNRRQVEAWNAKLAFWHQERVSRIGGMGLALAEVLYGGRNIDSKYGFNVQSADRSIAVATKSALNA